MLVAELRHLLAQALAIACGVSGAGWSFGAVLSKGQIETDDLNLVIEKSFFERDQERRVAIGSGAVSEEQVSHKKWTLRNRKGRLVGTALFRENVGSP